MPDVGSIAQPGPLAYFLTWTTYGSWLPGDERGWVDGRGGMHLAEPSRAVAARRSMKEAAVFLLDRSGLRSSRRSPPTVACAAGMCMLCNAAPSTCTSS